MEVNQNTVKFSLDKNFSWDKYENDLTKLVLNAKKPVNVLWDLRGVNKVPSIIIIGKQILLMKMNKQKIRENIIENIVYVRTNYVKSRLDWIFEHLYRPQNPTKIVSEENSEIKLFDA